MASHRNVVLSISRQEIVSQSMFIAESKASEAFLKFDSIKGPAVVFETYKNAFSTLSTELLRNEDYSWEILSLWLTTD